MDLITFKQHIANFIKAPNQQVLMVKGKWGVGKTHYITKSFEACSESETDEISLSKYNLLSVSLFGVESLETLDDKVANAIIASKSSKAKKLLESITSTPAISKYLPKVDITAYELEGIAKNSVILFDDLERSKLDFQKIFGYIDNLKNNSSFNCIIAFNDTVLEQNDWNFKEKVVDRELRLKSTLDSAITDVFGADHTLAKIVFNRMNIDNIRIVKKSANVMNYFLPKAEGLEDADLRKLKTSCLVHSSIYHSRASDNTDISDSLVNKANSIYDYDHHFPFNTAIRSYLDSQNIEDDIIEMGRKTVISNANRTSFVSKYKNFKDLVEGNFNNNTDLIIKACEAVITDENATFGEFSRCIEFLDFINEDINIDSFKHLFDNWNSVSAWEMKNLKISTSCENLSKFLEELISIKERKEEKDKKNIESESLKEETRESEISGILLQMANSSSELWIKELFKYNTNDWIAFFRLESSFNLINRQFEEISLLILHQHGRYIREAINFLKTEPANHFRFRKTLRNDIIGIVDSFDSLSES